MNHTPPVQKIIWVVMLLWSAHSASGQTREKELSDKTWEMTRHYAHLLPFYNSMDSNVQKCQLYTFYAGVMMDTFHLDPVGEPRTVVNDARHYLQLAIALDSSYDVAYILLGNMYIEVDSDNASGIGIYRQLLARDRHNCLARYNLGVLAMDSGHYENALPQFLQADVAELNRDINFYYSTGQQYNDIDNPDEAHEFHRRAVRQKQQEVDLFDAIAVCYAKTGEVDKAIEYYRRSVQLDPTWANAYYQMGVLYGKNKNELDSCVALVSAAIKLNQHHEVYFQDLAVAYGIQGDNAKAAEILNEAIEHFPMSVGLYSNLANAYLNLGNKKKHDETIKKMQQVMRESDNK